MKTSAESGCSPAPRLIFACSGAADVGALADQAARKMTADGVGKMYCLAGIGGRVETILSTTRQAAAVLAIDGCAQECARKALEVAGFSGFAHLQLARDMRLVKGASPVTPERVAEVAAMGGEMFHPRVEG